MILVAGDVSLDITIRIPHVPQPDEKLVAEGSIVGAGGVAANVATAAVRLGVPSALCARVGDDPFGEFVERELPETGVLLSSFRRDALVSTFFTVSLVDPSGEKRLVLGGEGPTYPTPAQWADDLPKAEWCHTVPYDIDAATLLTADARRLGIPVSMDLEPAALGAAVDTQRMVSGLDTVIMNARAAALVASEPRVAAAQLLAAGVAHVIVTAGVAGATLWTQRTGPLLVATPRIHPVDTTGAGDVFAAAYVADRLFGSPPDEAIRFAVAAGSLACLGIGSRGSLPTRDEVLQLMHDSTERG